MSIAEVGDDQAAKEKVKDRLFNRARQEFENVQPLTKSESKIRYLTHAYIDKYIHLLNLDYQRTLDMLTDLMQRSDSPRKEAYTNTIKYFEDLVNEKIDGIHMNVTDQKGINKQFYAFQKGFVHFAKSLLTGEKPHGIMNADEMGVGKTAENIAAVLNLPRAPAHPSRPNIFTVITPKSAVDVWKNEIAFWTSADHPVFVAEGYGGKGKLYRTKNDKGIEANMADILKMSNHTDAPEPFIIVTFESMRGSFSKIASEIQSLLSADELLLAPEILRDKKKFAKAITSFELSREALTDLIGEQMGTEVFVKYADKVSKIVDQYLGCFYALKNIHPDAMIIDEAHRMRNMGALQTKALMAFKDVLYKISASGTPLRGRNARKLWPLLHWLEPERYPSVKELLTEFPDTPDGRWGLGMHLRDTIMIRRTQQSVLKGILPPLHEDNRVLDFETPEREEYVSLHKEMEQELEDLKARRKPVSQSRLLAKINSLVYFVSGIRKKKFENDEQKNPKLKELNKIVREYNKQKRPLVVFAPFTTITKGLKEYYENMDYDETRKMRVSYFDGSLSEEERAEAVKKFQAGETDIFISSDAGEESITLTRADTLINYGMDWDLPDQRIKRVHRLSQTKPVTVINLFMKNTVDDNTILPIHAAKQRASAEIVNIFPPTTIAIAEELKQIIQNEFGTSLEVSTAQDEEVDEDEVISGNGEADQAQTTGGVDWRALNRTTTPNSRRFLFEGIDVDAFKDITGLSPVVIDIAYDVDLSKIFIDK
jgi:SNF2 family DNA or RNA helicase